MPTDEREWRYRTASADDLPFTHEGEPEHEAAWLRAVDRNRAVSAGCSSTC